MKNIHLLPTDKPSRLGVSKHIVNIQGIDKRAFNNEIILTKLKIISNKDLRDVDYIPQNIYITSDEEIKEGDWLIVDDEDVMQMKSSYDNDMSGEDIWVGDSLNGYATYKGDCKKIILTTDQDLINDSVQAIDDEFLEWFVKNSSCENIEINDWLDDNGNIAWGGDKRYQICNHIYDKIIIPKQESKQLTDLKIAMKLGEIEKEESKQDYSGVHLRHCYQGEYEDGCKYGEDDCPAKLLEKIEEDDERMYSEEEVYKLLLKHQSDYRSSVRNSYPLTWSFDIKDWFEKFKKK